jgi:hypothetical protein
MMGHTDHEPTTADWDRLRALCRRAELSPERVDRLEKSWSTAPVGAAVTILAGSPETLSLILARWLGPNAAKALSAVNGAALVIGPKPETVQPPLGRWPGFVHRELGQRHIVAVPSAGPLTASLRSAVGSLAPADQVLLVSRLSQPLSCEERQLAASLSPLAATARVVFVALPSEEGTEAERAELAAYGLAQLEAHGFRGRCLGAGVWYTEGPRPVDTVATLDDWLAARPADVAAGRTAAGRAALAALLAEIEKAPDRKPETALTAEEADELGRKFAHHVADLGRRLRDLADAGEFPDTAACRTFVVESLQGWINRTSLEGMLLDYVESLRPGIKADLTGQATDIAELLRYEPPPASRRRPLPNRGLSRPLAIAATAGVLAYVVIYLIGSPFLQGWFLILVANLGATAAALAGFAIAGHNLPRQRHDPATAESPGPSPVPGWASAELRLTNWFNGRIRSQTLTLHQECAAFRSRFQLEGRRP